MGGAQLTAHREIDVSHFAIPAKVVTNLTLRDVTGEAPHKDRAPVELVLGQKGLVRLLARRLLELAEYANAILRVMGASLWVPKLVKYIKMGLST